MLAQYNDQLLLKEGSISLLLLGLPGLGKTTVTSSNKNIPQVIAESAMLNIGHNPTSMKSVTFPINALSMKFPTAPPKSKAIATRSQTLMFFCVL
jgi:hypothetical protein